LLSFRKRTYPKVKRTKTDKVSGRKTVVSERKTVRQQIEEWPRIRTREMLWGKQAGRKLRPIAPEITRERRSVGRGSFDPIEKGKEFSSTIHTHPFDLTAFLLRRGHAIPSKADMISFLERFQRGKTESEIIASLSPSGMVKGYTIVSLKGVKKTKEQVGKELGRFLSSDGPFYSIKLTPKGFGVLDIPPNKNRKLLRAYIEGLEKIGFRFKHVPMPGYRFDKKSHKFKRKNLARKAVATLKRRTRKKKK